MALTSRDGQTARVAPWSRFEEAALDASVRRRLFTEDRAMVIWSSVTSKTFPPDHKHAVDQVVTVVVGRAEVRVGGRRFRIGPAQAVLVPGGMRHSIRRVGSTETETINVFSPES